MNKVITAIIALFITSTSSAGELDLSKMSGDNLADYFLSRFEESKPLEYPNIDCNQKKQFVFSKFREVPHGKSKMSSSNVCEAMTKSQAFKGEMDTYYPSNAKFGLLLNEMEAPDKMNGHFVFRPLINTKATGYLSLYSFNGIEYKDVYPIWVHEYGHAIFQTFLEESYYDLFVEKYRMRMRFIKGEISGYDNLNSQLNQLTNAMDEVFDQKNLYGNYHAEIKYLQDELNRLEANKASEEEKNKVKLQVAEKTKVYARVMNKAAKIEFEYETVENNVELVTGQFDEKLTSLSISYHEFFADVFAELFFDYPNSVYESLHSFKGDIPRAYQRRFSGHKSDDLEYDYESHVYFGRARLEFGKLIAEKEPSKSQKKKILDKLMAYSVDEISYYLFEAGDDHFLDYSTLVDKVASSKNLDDLETVFKKYFKDRYIASDFLVENVKDLCSEDFDFCKKAYLGELNKGRTGFIQLAPKIDIANDRMINILKTIFQELDI